MNTDESLTNIDFSNFFDYGFGRMGSSTNDTGLSKSNPVNPHTNIFPEKIQPTDGQSCSALPSRLSPISDQLSNAFFHLSPTLPNNQSRIPLQRQQPTSLEKVNQAMEGNFKHNEELRKLEEELRKVKSENNSLKTYTILVNKRCSELHQKNAELQLLVQQCQNEISKIKPHELHENQQSGQIGLQDDQNRKLTSNERKFHTQLLDKTIVQFQMREMVISQQETINNQAKMINSLAESIRNSQNTIQKSKDVEQETSTVGQETPTKKRRN